MGHAGVVRGGFDGRAVAVAVLAVVLAVVLGAVASSLVGAWAGVLAGLVPPAVLAVALEQRARNAARARRGDEILAKYAPPWPADRGDDAR